MKLLRDAWASATPPVRIALVVAVTALLLAAIYQGLDLSALLALLGAA